MSSKSANAAPLVQHVLYVVVKNQNRIYFQKKGTLHQLIATKIEPKDDLLAKAKKLLEDKIDEILPISEFRQISSRKYQDLGKKTQECYVFCVNLANPLDEEKLSNVTSFNIQNIKEDNLHDVLFKDITKRILLDNYASIVR